MKRPSAEDGAGAGGPNPNKRNKTKETGVDGVDKISGPYVDQFRTYQVRLDERNDRRERIIRHSRDITAGSKKAIFVLHRVAGQSESQVAVCLAEAAAKLDEMRRVIRSVAKEVAADGSYHLHHRSFSPGIQEYVEAESLFVYLNEHRLVSLQEIEAKLVWQEGGCDGQEEQPPVTGAASGAEGTAATASLRPLAMPVTIGDYVLGLADLTGELMRYSINSLGKGGDLHTPARVLRFVRGLFLQMSCFHSDGLRELPKKMRVMEQSLKKIERTCYNVSVRGAEIPAARLLEVVASAEGGGGGDED